MFALLSHNGDYVPVAVDFNVFIEVTHPDSSTDSRTYTYELQPGGTAPTNTEATITNIDTSTLDEGRSFTIVNTDIVEDPDTGDTHVFTACTPSRTDITCDITTDNTEAVLRHDGTNVAAAAPFTIDVTIEERTAGGETITHTDTIDRITLTPVNDRPTFADSSLDDVVVESTGPQTDVRPHLTEPEATDEEDGTITPTHDAAASYPVGTHTITWTATDSEGLFATLSQNVIVAPANTEATFQAIGTSTLNRGGSFTLIIVDFITDPDSGDTHVFTSCTETRDDVTCDISTPDELVLTHDGSAVAADTPFTVAVEVEERTIGGDTITHSTTLDITLVPFNNPPTFDVASLPDVTVEATGPLTDIGPLVPVPTATDMEDGAITPTYNAIAAGYALGTHVITWTATDSDGLSVTLDQNVLVESRDGLLSPPDAVGTRVLATTIGDPFTIGEGNQTLSVYEFVSSPVTSGNTNDIFARSLGDHQVDPTSERLILDVGSRDLRYLLIDLDTTLGELQNTIISDDASTVVHFQYNFTELTTQNFIRDTHLVIFDDDVVTSQSRLGAGTTVSDLSSSFSRPAGDIAFNNVDDILVNATLAGKSIGYIIEFTPPVLVSGKNLISIDFSLLQSDRTPINHINRTWTNALEIPPGLTPEQETEYRNLSAAIQSRNLAIIQQNFQIDYWSDASNSLAGDSVMAQDRIERALDHIAQTTIQRDSLQAQLDSLTS